MRAARGVVVSLGGCTLAACALAACVLSACVTRKIDAGASRTVRTSVGAEAPGTATQSLHGYVEGEIILVFTADGERAVSSFAGRAPVENNLRFGIPSLDRLNAKYRARQLVKVADVERGYVLRVAPDANVFRAIDEYKKDPLIAGADLHYLMRLPPPQEPGAVRTKTGPLRKEDLPVRPPPSYQQPQQQPQQLPPR